MSNQLVSVIIPTYKRPSFLTRAIFSVLSQSYSDVEILVVDDNNDGDEYRSETESVMKQFEDNSKVIYLRHAVNSNGSAARNTGINNAKGEYIVFLDDDDFFFPERIEKAVAFLESSAADIGGCCVNYIKKYKNYIYKQSTNDCVSCDCEDLLTGKVDYGAGSTLMLRKSVIVDVGGFDTSFKRHQDWEFMIRIFRRYKIACIPYLGVSISADGVRNTPNTSRLIEMKNKIFTLFKEDIEKLGVAKSQQIKQTQAREVVHSFLKGRHYCDAYSYYSAHVGLRNTHFKDIPMFILSAIVGCVPSFMIFIYWVLHFKYKRLNVMLSKLNYS